MRYLVFGIAAVALAILAVVYLLRRGSRDETGEITARGLRSAVARTSLILIAVGALLALAAFVVAGFDPDNFNVVLEDGWLFGF